jgi:hypothetical protein
LVRSSIDFLGISSFDFVSLIVDFSIALSFSRSLGVSASSLVQVFELSTGTSLSPLAVFSNGED